MVVLLDNDDGLWWWWRIDDSLWGRGISIALMHGLSLRRRIVVVLLSLISHVSLCVVRFGFGVVLKKCEKLKKKKS
jgi:hypothetical protein